MNNKKGVFCSIIVLFIYIIFCKYIIMSSDLLKSIFGFHFLNDVLEGSSLSAIVVFICKNVVVLSIIMFFLNVIFGAKNKRAKNYSIAYILFLIYFLLIKGVTNYFYFNINPSVFEYASFDIKVYFDLHDIVNVLLFIPLPIFIMYFSSNYKSLFFIFLVSPAIEFLQLFFNIGSFDIMDIIFNTLGVMIGILIYKIANKRNI